MRVTISQQAREVLITEKDIEDQQHERDELSNEIKLLESAIRMRQNRIAEITATLCMIQLAASHQLRCQGARYE